MTTTLWPSLHPCLLGMRISAYNGSAPSTDTVTCSWLSLLYTGRQMSLTLPMSLRLAGLITRLQLPFFLSFHSQLDRGLSSRKKLIVFNAQSPHNRTWASVDFQ